MKWIIQSSLIALAGALLVAGTVHAQDAVWQIRVRGVGVLPDESATISAINGDVDISDTFVPEIDFTVFFTPNIAAELILATTKHDVMAVGTDLGDVDLGSVWLLPPTLTIQYHFLPEGPVRPYIGAGGNLTLFYSVDVPGTTVTDADYSTAFGPALQVGADIPIGEGGWFLNFDAKKVLLDTDVELNAASILADVSIDPWVVGAGFGYTFR